MLIRTRVALAARLEIVPSTLNTTTENKETKFKTMISVHTMQQVLWLVEEPETVMISRNEEFVGNMV
jgi:hypothetical protein